MFNELDQKIRYDKYSILYNNTPEVFFPFGGTSNMEHIHTTFHRLEETTKEANSVQKHKIKYTAHYL